MNQIEMQPAIPSANVNLDRFFDLSRDLLCVADLPSGRFLRLSKSWEQVLGYRVDELLAGTVLDFIHPDDQAKTAALMHNHRQGQPVADFINRYRCRDGSYRYLSWRSSAMDAYGQIVATARDVTDEHLAAQALAAERARLRAVMDSIADLVFIKDNDFRYLGCNRPFSEFMGHAEADLLGHDDFEFFQPDLAQFFRDNDMAMLRTMAPRRNEEWLTYPDGRRRLFDTQKVPLIDADGRQAGVVGVSRDITEQKQLRATVDFLGSVVNHSRDPLYCVSPSRDFSIVYVNDATCALLGRGRDEILAAPLGCFSPAMDRAWAEALWQRIQGTDAPVMVELWLRAADGGEIPVELSASQVRHQDEEYMVGWIRDISARHQAERQLREREALYHASVEATADGFWQFDDQGRILDVNSAYVRMSGYTLDELRGMNIAAVEALDRSQDVAERIALLKQKRALSFESRHRRKDGSVWDVEVNVLYSEIEGGHGFAYLRDLRQRRRADSLLAARVRLAEMGRGSDAPTVMTEVLEIAQRLTASVAGFFHFVEPDQRHIRMQVWSGPGFSRLFHGFGPDGLCPIDEAGSWAECLRQGQTVVVNEFGPSGPPVPEISRLLTVPVVDNNGFGAIIGVGNKSGAYDDDDAAILTELAAVAMDIVNRIRAEDAQRQLSDALARTARQWNAAMDRFKGGIALLDKDCRLLRANAAFFDLTQSTPDRLGKIVEGLADTGGHLVSGLPTDRAAELVLEAGHRENPSGLPLEVRVAPMRDALGRPDGMVLSLYDLTRLRRQEQRLEQTVAKLTRSNADLERFGQVAAHDLQEPTRRQVLFAQLLQRQLTPHLDSESRQYLDFLISDALKMRDMVRALNVYHQAGRTLRPAEAVVLDQVVEDVLASLAPEIDNSNATLCLGRLGTVMADRSRVHLLFVNLISNALKFRHPERVPHIAITASTIDDMLVVAVADNGIGIAPAYRDTLFSLFRRGGDTTAQPHDGLGTGMGLAQCRRIVEDFGGRIWIEDGEPGGVAVKFSLPLKK